MITNPKSDIWVEKYRPTKLEDLVLQDDTRAIFNKFVTVRSIPHLILTGQVGTGKTTVAKILMGALDCQTIEMNASDERGIEVVRNKIKSFAMMQSTKKLKVVFLDEADAMTPEAQDALKRTIEVYSNQTRFILACNSVNRIISAIQSRCQVITFQKLEAKVILGLLRRILDNEKVNYNVDDLLLLIDDYSPKIRNMIGNLQLNTINNVYKYSRLEGDLANLLDLLKSGQRSKIRQMNLDYTEAMRYLFDKVDELTNDYEKNVRISLDIAEHLRDDTFCPDKEINFAACCLKIMEQIGVKTK